MQTKLHWDRALSKYTRYLVSLPPYNSIQFNGAYRPVYSIAPRFRILESINVGLIGATTKALRFPGRSVTIHRSTRRNFLKYLDPHRHLCDKIKSRFMHLVINVFKMPCPAVRLEQRLQSRQNNSDCKQFECTYVCTYAERKSSR
jgi:hypothetical protein